MIYARLRVILTTCNVGLIGLLAILGLALGLVREWFPGERALCPGSDALDLLLAIAVYIGVSLPFDWLGGNLAPRKFKRTKERFGAYFARWLRGVIWHGLFLFGVGMLILVLFRATASLALVVAALFLLMMLQVLMLKFLAFIIGNIRVTSADHGDAMELVSKKLSAWKAEGPNRMLVVDAPDRTFVGGWAGLGPGAVLLVPMAWLRDLKPEVVACQLVRRRVLMGSGLRWRGLFGAALWNLLGLVLVWLLLPGIDLNAVAGVVELALGCTLWSILGILLSPVFNRAAVYHADQLAKKAGVPEDVLIRAFSALNRQQEDELAHSGSKLEAWFNPYPSLDRRIHCLTEGYHGLPVWLGAWQLAPMSMVLSWPCLGLVNRAVQSNIGKPDLWVILPGD